MAWDLRPMKATLRSRSATALAAGTEVTALLIRAAAPRVSGELANSITVDPGHSSGDRFAAKIQTNSVHAQYVYEGTGFYGPAHHAIIPVSAPMLIFEIGGTIVHAQNTAGQRPQKEWWDNGINTWKEAVATAYAARFGR
jgi:hypothetical protein